MHRVKPDSVAIGELAIAAGAAGFPITVAYRYFGAHLLTELWRYHFEQVESKFALHIRRDRDLRRVKEGGKDLQAIFVSRSQLYLPVAWTVLLHPKTASPRPAIFCQFADHRDPEEDPAATLVLHGRHGEPSRVATYLAASKPTSLKDLSKELKGSIALDATLAAAIDESLSRPRDRQAVRSLLIGQCVMQHPPALGVSIDHYSAVYSLVQSPILRPSDEPFDPLARDMVHRANAYLALKQSPPAARIRQARLATPTKDGDHTDHDSPDRRLTRRELTNLGNPRGAAVQKLLKHLLDCDEGYRIFRTLGIYGCPSDGKEWRTHDSKAVAKFLIPWSEKQVRDHFHRLYQAELITARRDADNGPWRYDIPETLTDASSAFRKLPPPEKLWAAPQPSPAPSAPQPGLPGSPAVCPEGRADGTNDEPRTYRIQPTV